MAHCRAPEAHRYVTSRYAEGDHTQRNAGNSQTNTERFMQHSRNQKVRLLVFLYQKNIVIIDYTKKKRAHVCARCVYPSCKESIR